MSELSSKNQDPSLSLKDSAPNYEKLRIWQESMELALEVYKTTSKFPKGELFGLTSQLRRAASSVSFNIAEGSGRGTREFLHFLMMAATSINEVLTALTLAFKLEYVTEQEHDNLRNRYLVLMRQIQALRAKLHKKTPNSKP